MGTLLLLLHGFAMKAPMTLDLSTIAQLVAEALQARGVRADQSTFCVDPTRFVLENRQQPDGSYVDVVTSFSASIDVIVDFHQTHHASLAPQPNPRRGLRYVYIASPYTLGDREENVRAALAVAQELLAQSLCPFVPLLSHYWEAVYPNDYEVWMQWCLGWVRRCDAVLRLPGESAGADREVALAKQLGLPVFASVEDVVTAREVPDAG